MKKPFCVAPFAEGFSGAKSAFRNCCVTDPHILSLPEQTFEQWWADSRLNEFRDRLLTNAWPTDCHRCQIQEQETGHSFRTALNESTEITKTFGLWPSRWNLKFGNICNLACWTCDEKSSSVIQQNKKVIGILPDNFVDPEETFQQQWKTLKQDVLKSYDYHDTVTLTLLGGEPLYNSTVIEFLQDLKTLNLSKRTRLEFHTNGTKFNHSLFADRDVWNYVCIFISLDAVGKKAEWLRYGCNWSKVESNIKLLQQAADYVEVHCTLSVLNLNDLPELGQFCQTNNLPLKIIMLASPEYMSILKWSGDPALVADRSRLERQGFASYYDRLGKFPDPDAVHNLKHYIEQFDGIRQNLQNIDPKLARAIGLK